MRSSTLSSARRDRIPRALAMKFTTSQGAIVAIARIADRFGSRLVGLLAHRSLDATQGLLLLPGGSIHTVGMRFAIDAVFLDAQLGVLKVAADVKPFRQVIAPNGTWAVLELCSGRAMQCAIVPGAHLSARVIAGRS